MTEHHLTNITAKRQSEQNEQHEKDKKQCAIQICTTWWRSIVVRTLVLAGELSLSCARRMDGRLTTLCVKRPLSVNQQGQLSLPSLRGRLNE